MANDLRDSILDISQSDDEVRVNSGSHFFDKSLLRIKLLVGFLGIITLFFSVRNERGSLAHIFEIICENEGSLRFNNIFNQIFSNVSFLFENSSNNISNIRDDRRESSKHFINQLLSNILQISMNSIQKFMSRVSQSLQQGSDQVQE